MISQTIFTILLGTAWVAEFVFGSIVVYWFITQGFNDGGTTGERVDLESWKSVRVSLAAWGGFFAILLALIVFAN